MKKKIFNIILVILTIGMIYEVYSYFSIKHNNKVFEDIKTVDVFNNKEKTLSIMIQQDDYSFSEASDRSKWPSKTDYMYVGTKCVDASNQDIADSTKYVNFDESKNTATITTKQTIYCTLYFAKGRPALEVLKAKGGDYYAGGNNTAVDGLYRFKGTKAQITNNYICLGDENPDVCKTNTDNMYRIIGVTTEGNLKVIKASKSSSQQWFSSYSDSRKWNESIAYTYLNGTFYNSIDKRIQGLIEKHTWNMELTTSTPGSTAGKQDGTVSAYVGLMYGSDYVNAYQNSSTDNWLFIQNGYSGNTAENEWTMSRYGCWGLSEWHAWNVSTDGGLFDNMVDWSKPAVRPVFYLQSTAGLIGFGTADQPYTVTSIK